MASSSSSSSSLSLRRPRALFVQYCLFMYSLLIVTSQLSTPTHSYQFSFSIFGAQSQNCSDFNLTDCSFCGPGTIYNSSNLQNQSKLNYFAVISNQVMIYFRLPSHVIPNKKVKKKSKALKVAQKPLILARFLSSFVALRFERLL